MTPPSLQCHSSTDRRDEGYFTRPAWLLPVRGKRLGTDNPCYHIYSGWARWCRQLRSAQRDDGCFGWAGKRAVAHQRATGAASESTGYVWECTPSACSQVVWFWNSTCRLTSCFALNPALCDVCYPLCRTEICADSCWRPGGGTMESGGGPEERIYR